MGGVNEPISTGTEDPEYYARLLMKTSRPASWRLPSDEWPDVFGIQGVDDPHARRLQTLLDVVADISLCQQGNVSATMACVKHDSGTLQTRLYIVFNHQNDEAARRCPQHLNSIFDKLHKVPYMPPERGSRLFADELKDDFIEILRAVHNYSFDIFAHRVTKREDKLSDIRGYIEQDRTYFMPKQRSTLAAFFRHVDKIITAVHEAQATKELHTIDMRKLLSMYSYWTNPERHLLPKDGRADDKFTLLDMVDEWLAEKHHIAFKLRRWALKIMSLLISANRLFGLTQSRHLRSLLKGKFVIQVLTPPTTIPYCCNLSSEAIQVALDAALAGTTYLSAEWDKERESFMERLLNEPEASEVVHKEPTVHPELAMITAMYKGQIEHILPHIGVSKHSCIMCSYYILAFNEVTKQNIAIKRSHGKAYPGWSWPSLPDRDRELRPAFLKLIRKQLLSDFEYHARPSSVWSDGVVWKWDPDVTEEGRLELIK